jgi:mono/diheme cytochrome c family protein
MRAASLVLFLLAAGAAQAQGIDRGRLLYETHCATCHTERLHEREKSAIRSYADLRGEVGRRAALTNRRFSPDELEDIIEFLDRSHYRLDVPRSGK